LTEEQIADRDSVWARIATECPSFTRDHDIAGNYHAVREIVLGGSVPWAAFHKKFRPFAGARVMDIGANLGIFSAYCAVAGADVVAYEPHPNVFPLLDAMIGRTGLGRKINAINQGIWEKEAVMSFLAFSSPGDDCMRYNGSLKSDGMYWLVKDWERATHVPCVMLDEAIGLSEWDCIKMDIEGAECEVLLAASDHALAKVKLMFVEFHPWVSSKMFWETLERVARIYDISPVYQNALGRWDAVILERKA
jgi:FkbM family methyltransferase